MTPTAGWLSPVAGSHTSRDPARPNPCLGRTSSPSLRPSAVVRTADDTSAVAPPRGPAPDDAQLVRLTGSVLRPRAPGAPIAPGPGDVATRSSEGAVAFEGTPSDLGPSPSPPWRRNDDHVLPTRDFSPPPLPVEGVIHRHRSRQKGAGRSREASWEARPEAQPRGRLAAISKDLLSAFQATWRALDPALVANNVFATRSHSYSRSGRGWERERWWVS